VVDGAEVLVALPGQVDLILWVAGVLAVDDLGLLLRGEVFHAVVKQAADLVERAPPRTRPHTENSAVAGNSGAAVSAPPVVSSHEHAKFEARRANATSRQRDCDVLNPVLSQVLRFKPDSLQR
jgi:hypothetical protein